MTRLVSADLISALQTAVSPVILISGVGLLLLTVTNRLGRTVDRARALHSREHAGPAVKTQLKILAARARTLRWAVMLLSVSALFAALLVILLFVTVLLQMELATLMLILFILAMVSLVAALILFIRDVNQSLEALKAELDHPSRSGDPSSSSS